MSTKPVGLYREEALSLSAGHAEVGATSLSMSVTEARYREDGYEPPYEVLPTKSEYVATLRPRRVAIKPVRWRPPVR
jgi:hypothetical protein